MGSKKKATKKVKPKSKSYKVNKIPVNQNKNWVIYGPLEGVIEIQTRKYLPGLVAVVSQGSKGVQHDVVHESNNIILNPGVCLLGEL
jgi:hypothetical protein